jgi:hypothetical protein
VKPVLIFFAIVIGAGVGFYTVLQNGSLLRFLDSHPQPKVVPAVEFYIAEGFYIWNELQDSATYYQRIAERYPNSSYADDAFFGYLQSLDDMNTPHWKLFEGYTSYVERFPNGNHLEIAKKRVDYTRNTR